MTCSHFTRMVCLAAVLTIPLTVLAEDPHPSTYKLVATVGAGASIYTSPEATPSWMPSEMSRFGPSTTLRVMWRPDHLLSVGLESGWSKLYSYETSGPDAGSVYMSQIPLYLVWSMRFWDACNVTGGYGYSRLNTNLQYAGTVNVGTWSMGWLAACSYERPLSPTLGLAAEVKWISAVESHDASLMLQVQLVYSFFEW